MGEAVRQRVLRALGLAGLWVHIDALSARMRRIERELEDHRKDPPRMTLRAAPPPPPDGGER
jgi:hypothetical protein